MQRLGFDWRVNGDSCLREREVARVSDAMSHAVKVGSNVVFDFGGGDVLTVQNITLAAIQDDLLII